MVAVQSHCCEGHAWRLGTSWYRIRCQTFLIFWCLFQPFFLLCDEFKQTNIKGQSSCKFFLCDGFWVLTILGLIWDVFSKKWWIPKSLEMVWFWSESGWGLATNQIKAWSSLWSGWLQWFWENHLDGKVQKSRVRTSWGWVVFLMICEVSKTSNRWLALGFLNHQHQNRKDGIQSLISSQKQQQDSQQRYLWPSGRSTSGSSPSRGTQLQLKISFVQPSWKPLGIRLFYKVCEGRQRCHVHVGFWSWCS